MNQRQNYREQQKLEKTALVALGLVSDRYTEVSNIEFRMTYFRRGSNVILMKRTLSFISSDYASFHIKCMEDGCTGGGFDLAPVVAMLAKSHKKTAKGTLYCHGMNHTIGHASLAYEINIQYQSRPKGQA
ncbi:MAG: hypothetical protein WC539_08725 [Nitrospirota bacterium]